MAKPVFIICSRGGSEDRLSGNLSLFEVIERMRFTRQPNTILSSAVQMRVTSAWRRDAQDVGLPFDSECAFQMEGVDGEVVIGRQSFSFSPDIPNQRLSINLSGGLPIQPTQERGLMRVISRIRPVGREEWQSQEYSIIVEEFSAAELAEMIASFGPPIEPI
jgi:hypothetical protein